MAYSPAVKAAKRAEAIAEITALKDQARQVYASLATVGGSLVALPTKYAGIFNPAKPDDAAIIADFQAVKVKVDGATSDLQAQGIDALGTNTEV